MNNNSDNMNNLNIENLSSDRNTLTHNNYKYDVFISYRHTEPDASIAKALHKLLEEYKVPAELEGSMKWRHRSFIDREELAGADLSDSIVEAIKSSYCLISVCSSSTKDSPWCIKEIELFKKLHNDDRIFVLLIEGEPEEVFPDVIKNLKKGDESDEKKELLAADIRPLSLENYEKDMSKGDFTLYKKEAVSLLKSSEIHRIMAGIYGVSYGDIKQRQRERQMRLWLTASGFISAFLIVFASSMIWMYLQALEAERTARQQTILMTLNYADDALDKGDRAGALIIAEKAMEEADDTMKRIDYINALNYSVLNRSLINESYTSVARVKSGKKSPFFVISKSSDKVIALGEGRNINIWDIKNGNHEKSREASNNISSIVEHPLNEEIFCSLYDGSLLRYDINSGQYKHIYTSETFYSEMGVSRDGTRLIGLAYVAGGRKIDIVDLDNNSLFYSEEFSDEDAFSYASISKDSRYFAYITSKGTIRRIDMKNDEKKVLWDVEDEEVTARNIDYDDEGRLYYVDDYELYIFYEDGRFEKKELEHKIKNIEISGDTIYMGMLGFSSIALYDLENHNIKGYLLGNTAMLVGLTVSEKTKEVAALWSDKTITIWKDIKEGENKIFKEISLEDMAELNHFKYSPDGSYLISSFNDGSISFIETKGSISADTLPGKPVAQSTNFVNVLMENDANLSIYNMESKNLKDIGSLEENYINIYTTYALSNSGRFVAISDASDKSVLIKDSINNKELIITYQGNYPQDFALINDIIFANDEKSINIMYSSKEMISYSLENGDMIGIPYDTGIEVLSFISDKDNKYMALNFVDKSFKIIDSKTYEELLHRDGKIYSIVTEGKDFKLIGIVDDDIFYASGFEEPIRVSTNNLREGAEADILHTNSISPDLKYLLTTVANKNVVLTDAKTGVFIKQYVSDTNVYQRVFFGPDSDTIIYQGGKNISRIEYIPSYEELIKKSKGFIAERELSDEELEKIGKER